MKKEFDIKITDMDLSFVFEANGISEDINTCIDSDFDDTNKYESTTEEAVEYLKSLNIEL